ncbi:putative gustatory receptor 28b [Nilaparvata lugens]|uniref:putative gustatory receptor 28b n=1 Tax=Nilaparvata lugens TaxID=108931 RepID=UPI00193EA708|nr:putative gustatory receptor 28b [Nilaparvata lugens]
MNQQQLDEKQKNMARKIFRDIMPIVHLSRVLGTVPYKYTSTGLMSLKPTRIAYTFLIISFYLLALLYISFTTEIFSTNKKEVTQITHTFNIVFESLTFIISLISALLRAKEITVRVVNMIRVDKSMVNLGVVIDFDVVNRRFYFCLLGFLLFLSAIFAIDYAVCFVYNVGDAITFMEWIFIVFLFFYNRLHQVQFVFFIYGLWKRFLGLNVEMKSLKSADIYEKNLLNKDKILKTIENKGSLKDKIRSMKEIHDRLTSLCNQANETASLRNLLLIAINTVTVTSHLYVIASMVIDNKYEWHIFAYSIYWCVFRVLDLFVIILTCAKVSNEANHTAIVIHDLLSSREMVEIAEELEHFSIQLLHHKIAFTACDFFPIDFTLLYSVD